MKFESWTSCEKICARIVSREKKKKMKKRNTQSNRSTGMRHRRDAREVETEENHNLKKTTQNYNLFLFGNVLINKFIHEKYDIHALRI